jgi:hypothetical protein
MVVSDDRGAMEARGMAYNEALADRILARLIGQPGLDQKKMFGGISFMVQGNFCCGVVKEEVCVRVGQAAYDEALAQPGVRPMDFTGKPMAGWVFVGGDAVSDDDSLGLWVERGLKYALSLPAK